MKIIHVDKNNYYGGEEAALSLSEAEEWAERTAAANASLDATLNSKVNAFLKTNNSAMEEAGLLNDGKLPKMFTGNISPWAQHLDWHAYWAGKPVAAIGSLGPSPLDWPGAWAEFCQWIMAVTRFAAKQWMECLIEAGHMASHDQVPE